MKKPFHFYVEWKCGQCWSEIRLYILYSLILIYIVHRSCLNLSSSVRKEFTDILARSLYLLSLLTKKMRKAKCLLQKMLILNPFPNKPWFLRVCRTSALKTPWEKEKLLVTSNFSFSHSVFYLFGELSATFNKFEIVVCKLFQFGRV